MKIGFMGDTHGNYAAARFMLWTLKRQGVDRVVQVGDFGIYSDSNGLEFAGKVNKAAQELGLFIWVVPGNHENWRIINELFDGDREKAAVYRSNIWLLPRGFRWSWGGMSFVALGGAPSVDRKWRRQWDDGKYKNNMSWYAEEMITPEDVNYTVAGGYADVMIGHDAPNGVQTIDKNIRGNPHGFDRSDLLYAEEGRLRMTEAFRGVSPLFFFHGHYHFPVNELVQRPQTNYGDLTQIVGLNCEFANYSTAVLDTDTLDVAPIDHQELLDEYRKENVKWRK